MKDAIFGFFFASPKNQIVISRIAPKQPLVNRREAKTLGGMLMSSGALKFSGGAKISL
jgi:hypothetical protein